MEEEPEEEDLRKPEEDREYWKRVLGDAYEEHRLQMLQEQENLAASLGKGKRTRRQVNLSCLYCLMSSVLLVLKRQGYQAI